MCPSWSTRKGEHLLGGGARAFGQRDHYLRDVGYLRRSRAYSQDIDKRGSQGALQLWYAKPTKAFEAVRNRTVSRKILLTAVWNPDGRGREQAGRLWRRQCSSLGQR